ncbi:hypothetical protein GCM10022259_21170 [Aquimarina mytili]
MVLLFLSKKKIKWTYVVALVGGVIATISALGVIAIIIAENHSSFEDRYVRYRKAGTEDEYVVQRAGYNDYRYVYVKEKFLGVSVYEDLYLSDFDSKGSIDVSDGTWYEYDYDGNKIGTYEIYNATVVSSSKNRVDAIEAQDAYQDPYEEEGKEEIPYKGYYQETIDWSGGPTPLTENIRYDFYWTLFLDNVDDYVYYGDNEEPDTETIRILGNEYDAFLNGAYGLGYYSGMQSAVHRFNHMRGADNELQKHDFWDFSYAENFIGLPIYDKARQEALKVSFDCYNPKTVQWLFDNMIPDPDTVLDEATFQDIYNVIGSRYFRLMMESYIYLRTKGIDQEVHRYREAMKDDDFKGHEYLENHYGSILDEYVVEEVWNSTTYLSPKVAVGYWLRRLIDGSAKDFFNGHEKVIKIYDKDWFDRTLEKYDFESLDLVLSPISGATNIHHICLVFLEDSKKEIIAEELNDIDFKFDYANKLEEKTLLNSLSWSASLFDSQAPGYDMRMINPGEFDYYLGSAYTMGDFKLFTFALKGTMASYWFAAVFSKDKMLNSPILLSSKEEFEGDNTIVRFSSKIEVQDNDSLLIKYKRNSETEKSTGTREFSKTISVDDNRFITSDDFY